jgi:hypothetical protein
MDGDFAIGDVLDVIWSAQAGKPGASQMSGDKGHVV